MPLIIEHNKIYTTGKIIRARTMVHTAQEKEKREDLMSSLAQSGSADKLKDRRVRRRLPNEALRETKLSERSSFMGGMQLVQVADQQGNIVYLYLCLCKTFVWIYKSF